jgi:hypothetical protein
MRVDYSPTTLLELTIVELQNKAISGGVTYVEAEFGSRMFTGRLLQALAPLAGRGAGK